jgi:hypothetical protein
MLESADTLAVDHRDMLGRSIADPLVVSYLAFHEKLDPADFRENADMGFYGGDHNGFGLSADALCSYTSNYEQVRSRYLPDDQERIVTQICFTGLDTIMMEQRSYVLPLPLGLAFGDGADVVSRKLGTEPTRQGKGTTPPDFSAERFVWWYEVDGLEVIAKFDVNLALMAVYLLPINRGAIQAKKRRASLQKESENILPGNVGKVEALRANIPTPRWREALAEGDKLFNEPDIAEAEALLNTFIDDVKAGIITTSAPAIYEAVKRVILGLNKIQERSGMIETLERDELGVLIDEVVAATGFKIAEGEDITSEWREW